MCAIFQVKRTTLTFLVQICPNFWVGNSESSFWNKNQPASPRYHLYQFSCKKDNFDFDGPNLPKNVFCGRNFKNLSLDSESAPPRFHVCQFSVKMDGFEFFILNLEKLLNYVQYFGSDNVASVVESWVETEMSWTEVDEAGWMLKWAGWRWMELGGGWCTG